METWVWVVMIAAVAVVAVVAWLLVRGAEDPCAADRTSAPSTSGRWLAQGTAVSRSRISASVASA